MAGATTIERAAPPPDFLAGAPAFLEHLRDWYAALPDLSLGAAWDALGIGPRQSAVCSVDAIEGFCDQGPLASARVGRIVRPIAALFDLAHRAGVRDFILTQDTHPPDAEEFAEWPPHCLRGTAESKTVAALGALAAAGTYRVFEKNSISSTVGTGLEGWLDEHPQVRFFLCVGDCTDLCLYQLAMGLKLRSNARGLGTRVVVPADCVDTYDLPLEAARAIGAPAHDGDVFHVVFLYHLALNGVKVVRRVVA